MKFSFLVVWLIWLPHMILSQTHQLPEWSYEGKYGPNKWAQLCEAYRPCGGEIQSPIDICNHTAIHASINLDFHYHPFYVDLLNNGHTVVDYVMDKKALTFNGVDYNLLQFHFHTPSEHHLDGTSFPMEIHFVHQSSAEKYAVIAVFFEEGDEYNTFLSHFIKNLPREINEEVKSHEEANPEEILSKVEKAFYFYDGSLTTPPCSEGVNWIVLKDPVTAHKSQLDAIHSVIHDDNRPIQPVRDRLVFFSDPVAPENAN